MRERERERERLLRERESRGLLLRDLLLSERLLPEDQEDPEDEDPEELSESLPESEVELRLADLERCGLPERAAGTGARPRSLLD